VLAFALTAWTSGLVDRLLSANAQGLTVETGEFGDLLQIDVENDWGNYEVEIRRGPSHPDSAAAWEALATAAANEAARLHAVVVREGQDLYVQLRDDKDRMLAENKVNLRPLVTAADGTATVRLPGRITASRVVLSVTRYEKK
ncbi:MAG: hypothetical protein KDC98_17745, partial [Planctomycetes bacterium]|nr:hypothetical protein [Planctomycetota bacterium]